MYVQFRCLHEHLYAMPEKGQTWPVILTTPSNFHYEEIQQFHHYHEMKGLVLLKTLQLQLFTLEVCANTFVQSPFLSQV